ncbi:replication initiator [Streptomyces purpureus]|uniref:replication initiator n=1 Tax=Streptomyces purpureus TaxID=1951 RepID=UPI00378A0199
MRGTDFTGGGPVTDRHVAAYIAKYATKGAETTTGTLDRRLRLLAELAAHDITNHARRMIHTAWHLATNRRHAHLRLRQWAHMLGFRGHFSTRTRHYSTTLTHLRAQRTAWRTGRPATQTPAPASAQTQAGQTDASPVGDRAGRQHRPGPRSPQHRRPARELGHDPGHLPLAVHRNRPPARTRTPRRPPDRKTADPTRTTDPNPTLGRSEHSGDRAGHSAGHPVGHSTDRLPRAVQPGSLA